MGRVPAHTPVAALTVRPTRAAPDTPAGSSMVGGAGISAETSRVVRSASTRPPIPGTPAASVDCQNVHPCPAQFAAGTVGCENPQFAIQSRTPSRANSCVLASRSCQNEGDVYTIGCTPTRAVTSSIHPRVQATSRIRGKPPGLLHVERRHDVARTRPRNRHEAVGLRPAGGRGRGDGGPFGRAK